MNMNKLLISIIGGVLMMGALAGCIGETGSDDLLNPVGSAAAAFTASAYDCNIEDGEPISFDASASFGKGQLSYLWEFGDGVKASGRQVEHLFETPGYYDVRLTVKDSTGATGEAVQRIVAFQKIMDAVSDWTEPSEFGLIYPDDVVAHLQTRPVVLFFWYDGCPWCTVQELETNEIMDQQAIGPVKLYKVDVHADVGDLWGDLFRIYYVPTTIVVRQDGLFVALIGAQTYGTPAVPVVNDGDVKAYVDEALQFKADNYADKISEHPTSSVYNPTTGEIQTIIDVPEGTTGLTAWIKWNAADASGTMVNLPNSAGIFDVVMVSPDGQTYTSDAGEFDLTVPKVPGNFLPDPYNDLAVSSPVPGKWTIKFVASSEMLLSPFVYNTLVRSGVPGAQCENGVCPP
ncbi:MAG: hypothetical protein CVT48_03570 [Thermoplasmata archaeon HGW-Thermoplasmata-1]|nr:MAG: hypothetical protein CVT48_03570 [Thermoplasmata archaeon HGW-Thermoplasmata-1]